MSKRAVTFGEIMLRLSPPGNERIIQAKSFDAIYGGGESNVAASLAQFGVDAYFVSKVPKNSVGISAVNYLRSFGVKTDNIVFGGDRLGVYFLESGVAQRPSKVIYDRANSAISEAQTKDFDWDKIFCDVDWFHWTGITPALSKSAASCVEEACKSAKNKGVVISCDLNYRKKLWTKDQAHNTMKGLMKYVDVCICNEADAADVFGIKAVDSSITEGSLNVEGYYYVAKQLIQMFDFRYVAITLRESFSASHNGWSAILCDGEQSWHSRRYDIIPIVDRVGGGDAFGGALIYSLLHDKDPQSAVEFAAAASCLKHSIPGDFNLVDVEEVELLTSGDSSGRVQR